MLKLAFVFLILDKMAPVLDIWRTQEQCFGIPSELKGKFKPSFNHHPIGHMSLFNWFEFLD